ncbi:hypothetical protein [Nocardia sp. NPDC051981]|uniref:hypothetical protein n=1 Tax=Nocardia sp. NPDC051981 TaxID=3155417 RepID=UPI003437D5D4
MSERRTEYLGRLSDGRYIFVSSVPGDRYYDTFRLYLGTADDMRPVEIADVERYRDGGTTRIDTAAGQTLSVPSPFKRSPTVFPRWHSLVAGGDTSESSDVELLDPLGYEITETHEGVNVRAVRKA